MGWHRTGSCNPTRSTEWGVTCDTEWGATRGTEWGTTRNNEWGVTRNNEWGAARGTVRAAQKLHPRHWMRGRCTGNPLAT